MSILYDEKQKTLTLHTKNTTYQMQVDRYGFLLHLYYGKRADGCMDYLLTFYDRGFSGNPYDAGKDKTYSMDALPQEFPSLGTGDYRTPACIIKNTDRTYSSDFRYVSHSIREGKYSLKGLPAVYADAEEAQTLEVVLEDRVSKVQAVLYYGVLPEYDVIARSVKIVNKSSGRSKSWPRHVWTCWAASMTLSPFTGAMRWSAITRGSLWAMGSRRSAA